MSGDDRLDFVHGLVTGDVKGLQACSGVLSLLLNHRGHALAQMTVLRLPEMLLLAVEYGLADSVFAELNRHIIFDQVVVERHPDGFSQLTVQAEDPALDAAVTALADLPGWLGSVAARRSQSGGTDLFFRGDTDEALSVLAALGSSGLDPAGLERERVAAGVPAAPLDAGEGVLPQEAGLEHLVSYRKGCYLGQEIMARIEARGNMRRGLRQIRLDGNPGSERDVTLDGRRVGRLGTVLHHDELGWTGLAILRLDLPADARLQAGDTTVTVS